MKLNKNNYLYYAIGKKYSYSSLKAMSKDDLIGYLDVAQHNYEIVNERLFNLIQHAEKFDEALKDAISILSGSGRCPHNCGYPCRETGKEDCQACWIKYFDEIYLIGDIKK